MTAGKNRALDELRRRKLLERSHESIAHEAPLLGSAAQDPAEAADDDIGDDLVRLMFIACHPVLSTEARTALTLRLLGGLSTAEIARAFLVPEPTIGQRIVRAKRTLAAARVPFEAPRAEERAARLSSVLEVIYLIFNEGYAATSGEDWMRPALCEEALRLGRILAELLPEEAEVHGLVALDGNSSLAHRRARRCRGRAHLAARAEPRSLEPADDPPRTRRARARASAGRRAGSLHSAGGDRRLSRPSAARRPTLTGRRSSRFTTRSPRSHRHPSSSSIAR